MTEVMLEMVALGFEHVVVFVFTFPPSATGLCHLCHVLCMETVIGDKGIVVELLARFGVDHGDLDPIDRECLLTVLQQPIIDEAIEGHFGHAPLPLTLFARGHGALRLPKSQAFIKLWMRVRFAHQDEVETLVQSPCTKRLLAVEIIAKQSYAMRRQGRTMVRDPAFACGLLTVLFVVTILRHDVFGRSGDALGPSRAYDEGAP